MAVTGQALGISLGINFIIVLISFFVFSLLRVNDKTRKFYSPKRFNKEVLYKPRRLPLGFVAWVWPTWNYPEDEIIKVAGLDSATYLRLLSFGVKFFFLTSLWVLAAVLPTNWSGKYLTDDQLTGPTSTFSDLDKYSASNIAPKNARFAVHTVSVYVITILALKMLWSISKDVSNLRIKFLAGRPTGGPTHTVLFTDIPGVEYGTMLDRAGQVLPVSIITKITASVEKAGKAAAGKALGAVGGAHASGSKAPLIDESYIDPWGEAVGRLKTGNINAMIEQEVKDVYGPDNLASINPVYNTDKAEPLLAQYDKMFASLEDLCDNYERDIKRKKPIKRVQMKVLPTAYGDWGKERFGGIKPVPIDAMDFYAEALPVWKKKIDIECDKAVAQSGYTPAAFVTFSNREVASLAATSMHSHDETAWRTQVAPDKDEILWKNVRMRYWERRIRTLLMWALFVAIVIFFLPVCAIIQLPVNIQNAKKIPILKDIATLPFVSGLIQGILPGLVLMIFLIILPPILSLMCRISGMVSVSQVDRGVVLRFFIFQYFAVFIYTFFTGSALSQIKMIIDDPSSIIRLLAQGASQQASFFMNFLAIQIAGLGLRMLAIVGVILFFILTKLSSTERAKRRIWADQTLLFGTCMATHTMAVVLGMGFCCLSPLIAPIAFAYFCVAQVVERYQLVWVIGRPYESSGLIWNAIFAQLMVAVYTFNVLTLFVLLINQFYWAAFIIPLLIVIFIFHSSVLDLFVRPWTLMSLKSASVMDKADRTAAGVAASGRAGSTLDEAAKEEILHMYQAPSFKVSQADLDKLLQEKATIDSRLAGEEHPDLEAQADEDVEPSDDHSPLPAPKVTPKEEVAKGKV